MAPASHASGLPPAPYGKRGLGRQQVERSPYEIVGRLVVGQVYLVPSCSFQNGPQLISWVNRCVEVVESATILKIPAHHQLATYR